MVAPAVPASRRLRHIPREWRTRFCSRSDLYKRTTRAAACLLSYRFVRPVRSITHELIEGRCPQAVSPNALDGEGELASRWAR